MTLFWLGGGGGVLGEGGEGRGGGVVKYFYQMEDEIRTLERVEKMGFQNHKIYISLPPYNTPQSSLRPTPSQSQAQSSPSFPSLPKGEGREERDGKAQDLGFYYCAI